MNLFVAVNRDKVLILVVLANLFLRFDVATQTARRKQV